MRIGVVGKGGSGKTSVSWMLLETLAQAGYKPVGLDADYNQHLSAMFGVSNSQVWPLAACKQELALHVLGTRTDITLEGFKKATKPTAQSRLLSLDGEDVFLRAHTYTLASGTSLLRVGEYEVADIGQRCYHASTAVVDIMLHHLQPTQRPLVIDYTAGVDPFASDVSTLLDAVVLVIEPTLKGVAVAKQWHELLGGKLPLHLIANKINTTNDLAWLGSALAPLELAAAFYMEPHIQAIERGVAADWAALSPINQQSLYGLLNRLGIREVIDHAVGGGMVDLQFTL